jgi:hypothetical protein
MTFYGELDGASILRILPQIVSLFCDVSRHRAGLYRARRAILDLLVY